MVAEILLCIPRRFTSGEERPASPDILFFHDMEQLYQFLEESDIEEYGVYILTDYHKDVEPYEDRGSYDRSVRSAETFSGGGVG